MNKPVFTVVSSAKDYSDYNKKQARKELRAAIFCLLAFLGICAYVYAANVMF